MATNNLLPFATASDANLTPESEWQSETLKSVREKGFQSGIAKSAQINRIMAQGANAGNVLGEISADYGATESVNATLLYPCSLRILTIFSAAVLVLPWIDV